MFQVITNTILEYINHPETKFGSEIGIFDRKHTDIDEFELEYIF